MEVTIIQPTTELTDVLLQNGFKRVSGMEKNMRKRLGLNKSTDDIVLYKLSENYDKLNYEPKFESHYKPSSKIGAEVLTRQEELKEFYGLDHIISQLHGWCKGIIK